MTRHRLALAAVLAALAFAPPLAAQTQEWQFRWFWGFKSGLVGYSLPSAGLVWAPQLGADWLITARRSALYVGYSSSLTKERDYFNFSEFSNNTATYPVAFDGMRRIQVGVLVMPWGGSFQPYVGGGFVIETLTNAKLDTTLSSSSTQTTYGRAVQDAASGGFGLVVLGLQLRVGRKIYLYGNYQLSPQGRAFLLRSQSHSLEGGIRLNLLGAREDDVTSRR